MLYFASHSNDEANVELDDIRSNGDLAGYIEGWVSAGHLGVIAEISAKPVGAAWLRVLGPKEVGNPVFVDHETPELAVAVEPGHEGRGIGTSIISALLNRAECRFPAVVLSARAGNPAVGLYERLGFEVVAEVTNRVGTESVKMVCVF